MKLIFLLHTVYVFTRGVNGYIAEDDETINEDIHLLDPHKWWGPNELRGHEDTSIRPFQIKFDPHMIQDLRYRLKHHRTFTPPLEGMGFQYGFNTDILQDWLSYWADKYPFEYRERVLNTYPQYKTNVQGLDIHFIWIRPKVPPGVEVVPLLMMHGFHGSVREFFEVIPRLTAVEHGRDFAIELVVPSLPGFGFSDAAVRPGLGAAQAAVLLRNLMHRLGHRKFYIQGGDFGGVTASYMSTLFPKEVLGYHGNWILVLHPVSLALQAIGALYPPLVVDPALAYRMYPLTRIVPYFLRETGYLHQQATKPDTFGIGLTDSPAGLLTQFLEKISFGVYPMKQNLTDAGLGLLNPDSVIDNLMMYWVPNTVTTSMRYYAETFNLKLFSLGLDAVSTPVPVWGVEAENEVLYQSPALQRIKYPNLLNSTALRYGGHFLAFELPEEFTECVLTAIGAFRRWHQDEKEAVSHKSTSIRNILDFSPVAKLLNTLQSLVDVTLDHHPESWWIKSALRFVQTALKLLKEGLDIY